MDLTEFASLIACNNTNTAKNTLSYLIGNGLSNSNWSKALAELYNSFPDNIKTSVDNKKEFLPVILKYFSTYQINKDNINIYQEYSSLYSAKNKDDLKKYNPNWVWDQELEIIFKNSLAFTNAIPNKEMEVFNFISQYETQFALFTDKQKDKIVKHFKTQNVWTRMQKEDYYKFVQLCDKYDFDRLAILKNSITIYTNIYNQSIFESENVNFYLDDLVKIGKGHLSIITEFYPLNDWKGIKKVNGSNVFTVLLESIKNKQYKSSMKWLCIFEKEINNYCKLYNVENNNSSHNFKELLNYQIEMLKSSNNKSLLELVLKNDDWFKFMDSYSLLKILDEKLPSKLKIKSIKI